MEPLEEECALAGWRFRRTVPRDAHDCSTSAKHIVSAAVFRLEGKASYRDSTCYAHGVAQLASAVQSHLPGFRLRVYCDASVDPRVIRRLGEEGQLAAEYAEQTARCWEGCFAHLAASGCADVVWWECPALALDDGSGGHIDLLGTIPRMLPLFDLPELPEWCGAPRAEGAVVLVTDTDYKDRVVEHALLHTGAWFAAAAAAAASAPFAAAGGACPTNGASAGDTGSSEAASEPRLPPSLPRGASAPDFLAYSATPRGPRHYPLCGMPPLIACLLASRVRFPGAWARDFLQDLVRFVAQARGEGGALTHGAGAEASRLPSILAARFRAEMLSPAVPGGVSTRGRGVQRVLPYGIDEFFLTTVLKVRAVAAPRPLQWLLVHMPCPDMPMGTAMRFVQRAVTEAEGAVAAPAMVVLRLPGVQRVLLAAAAMAGETGAAEAALEAAAEAAAAAATGKPGGGDALAAAEKVLRGQLSSWARAWSRLAEKRAGWWDTFTAGIPLLAQGGKGNDELGGTLAELLAALVDAMGAGQLPHSAEELERLVLMLVAQQAGGNNLITATPYAVGGGQVVPLALTDSPAGLAVQGLMNSLACARGCGLPAPPPLAAMDPSQAAAEAAQFYVSLPPRPGSGITRRRAVVALCAAAFGVAAVALLRFRGQRGAS